MLRLAWGGGCMAPPKRTNGAAALSEQKGVATWSPPLFTQGVAML
jgi:hypothetical protein